MHFKPRPYQAEDLRRIYNFRGRALLAWEQGLGKTPESLLWVSKITGHRPVLIVVPSSVKYAWKLEAWNLFRLRARVLEGQGPKVKRKDLVIKDDIIVLNYDILHFWLKVLMRNPPKVVIIDECQYISNPKARRTKAVKIVSSHANSVLALSGTPMTNKPIQLWSVLNIVRPDLFPDFNEFAWTYCTPKFTPWGWRFDGAVNKKQLWNILVKKVMIRRLKKDVAPELPDKIYKVIPVHMSPRQNSEYQKAAQHFLQWLKEKAPAKANRARRAEALVKVGYLLRLCASIKLPAVIEYIRQSKEVHENLKFIGMTMHTFVIERMEKEFPHCVVVDGKHTGLVRAESVRRFNHSHDMDFWGNYRAAGVGLNLQTSWNVIALDPPDTPGAFMQATDRAHRIGQKKQVIVHIPILSGTIEGKRWKIIRKRASVLSHIIDGKSDSGELQESMFDELLSEFTNKSSMHQSL